MQGIWKRRPSPAMVVAIMALVVATSGSAVAVTGLVDSAEIKNNTIRGKDVKNRSLGAKELSDKAVETLKGNTGAQGGTGARGATGATGATGARGVGVYDGAIPSGKTVTGAWGRNAPNLVGGDVVFETVSFPARAPANLSGANTRIGIKGQDGQVNLTVGLAVNDADQSATCTGTFHGPVAPRGVLCLYVRPGTLLNVQNGSLSVFALEVDGSAANRFGFGWTMAPAVNGDVRAEGTWAYTAP